MAAYTTETITTHRKRFILDTSGPHGAAINELHKMLAGLEQELGDAGNDAGNDDRAWVIAEDNRVVLYYDRPPHRASSRNGRCGRCGDPAAYQSRPTVSGGQEQFCAPHAADFAARGGTIIALEEAPF